MDFIDDTTVVTAGRDCVVNVFGVEGAARSTNLRVRKPRISRRAHSQKVRAIKVISRDRVRVRAGARLLQLILSSLLMVIVKNRWQPSLRTAQSRYGISATLTWYVA